MKIQYDLDALFQEVSDMKESKEQKKVLDLIEQLQDALDNLEQ